MELSVHDDRSLLALQGPKAAEVLQPLCKEFDLGSFYFSNFKRLDIGGIPAWLTRTGYRPSLFEGLYVQCKTACCADAHGNDNRFNAQVVSVAGTPGCHSAQCCSQRTGSRMPRIAMSTGSITAG